DVRDAVRPDEDLGARADGEDLVLARADQCAECGLVTGLDLDRDAAGVPAGCGEQLAAEAVELAAGAVACRRARDGGGGEGDGDRKSQQDAVCHGTLLLVIVPLMPVAGEGSVDA